MKIFWINHIFLDEDLHSSFVLEIINSLSKNGHSVHLIVPSIEKSEKPLFPLFNDTKYLPTLRLPYLSSLSFWAMLFLYLPIAIKRRKPDAIIANYPSLLGTLGTLFFPNIKLILDFRSPPVITKGIPGFLFKVEYYVVINIARHFFDGITVTSSAMKREMCSRFGMDPAKVGIVTVGVSEDLFDSKKYKVASKRFRKQLNVSGKFIVMYHGILTSTRGLQETVEAIARLKHPDIAFFMLGRGPFEEELKSLIAEKEIEDRVFIHEPVYYEEVPKFLSICDVGIVPWPPHSYHRVNSPLKLLEYLSMEKATIAADIPFIRELLANGKCGILIPSNDPKDILTAIMSAYNKRKILEQMGKMGRAIVEQHHSWKAKAKDIEAFLEKLGINSKRSVHSF